MDKSTTQNIHFDDNLDENEILILTPEQCELLKYFDLLNSDDQLEELVRIRTIVDLREINKYRTSIKVRKRKSTPTEDTGTIEAT